MLGGGGASALGLGFGAPVAAQGIEPLPQGGGVRRCELVGVVEGDVPGAGAVEEVELARELIGADVWQVQAGREVRNRPSPLRENRV